MEHPFPLCTTASFQITCATNGKSHKRHCTGLSPHLLLQPQTRSAPALTYGARGGRWARAISLYCRPFHRRWCPAQTAGVLYLARRPADLSNTGRFAGFHGLSPGADACKQVCALWSVGGFMKGSSVLQDLIWAGLSKPKAALGKRKRVQSGTTGRPGLRHRPETCPDEGMLLFCQREGALRQRVAIHHQPFPVAAVGLFLRLSGGFVLPEAQPRRPAAHVGEASQVRGCHGSWDSNRVCLGNAPRSTAIHEVLRWSW